MSIRPLAQLAFALAVATVVALSAFVSSAAALSPLKIDTFDGQVVNRAPDDTPTAATQAGSHPDEASTSFRFVTEIRPGDLPFPQPTASLKDLEARLPPGLVGDPTATPVKCTPEQLYRGGGLPNDADPDGCPVDSQVGYVIVPTAGSFPAERMPIYNMEPSRPDVPAQFAFNVLATGPIYLEPELRTEGDYGINIVTQSSSQAGGVLGSDVVLFGVPADPANDDVRGNCLVTSDTTDRCSTHAQRRAFITLPTHCAGPLPTTLLVNSWQFPNDWDDRTFMSHHPGDPNALVGVEGCERVPFTPTFEVEPETRKPGAPSGYTVDLRIPAEDNVDGIAQSHLRHAVVDMPTGVTMNPSAADGLAACSDEQVALKSRVDPQCPDASKIGAVTVTTPLLDEPLTGSVFLGTQLPTDRYRMFIVVKGPGMIVKLPGSVTPNSVTGQLRATFANNPQLPFSHMRLEFNGGSRAPLANPTECGTYTMTSRLTPWAANVEATPLEASRIATPSDSFTIDCPGNAGAFDPGFTAGATNPIAGTFSPFVARITRDSGKELGRIDMKMPRGSLAQLKHVAVCSEAQLATAPGKSGQATLASPACPAGSQVGTVTVGAGAGPNPYYTKLPGSNVSGRVFLTGQYNTAGGVPGSRPVAYGLAIEVPAVAGPFDLGTVVVRAGIYADPSTADLTVVSDQMPRILEGVPLNVRDVRVNMDRPRFTTNPTSCSAKQVRAEIRAQDGTTAVRTARYAVAGCKDLLFKPRLGMRLTGKKQTKTNGHPGVRAVVRQTGMGEAGIRRAEVRLPKTLALDPDNANALCEFEDGTKPDLENHCPAGSVVGRARAVSPLLKEALVGNVYFVKNVRIDKRTGARIRTLPMIVVALRGEVAINLTGKSSVKGGKLVNTFAGVPDAPISRFNLNIKGGGQGILVVTDSARGPLDVCRGPQIANVLTRGQNGARSNFSTRMKTPCGKKRSRR